MDASLLNELSVVARQAALAGGERLIALRDRFKVSEKAPDDFVTDADIASQEAVYETIRGRFPDHTLVGEEDASREPPEDPNALCWVVDPLDGTTNYLHQYPSYAVSVAVVQGPRLLAGAIFDPVRSDLYWAAAGQGAWLGDQRLSVSKVADLSGALVAMSLPPKVRRDSPDLMDFLNVVEKCQAIRRIGSAALNLAHLAAGRIDGYWARQIHAWDVAAGVLLIQEAGGVVTSSSGGIFDLWAADLAAGCCPTVHRELLAELSS